jgi:DHA2 family multidrug resistance protein
MSFVEDPPWQESFLKTGKKLNIDFVGIGFITLGLGCLQIFLDRGEDDDWISSRFICAMMALSAIGLCGAVIWLTTTANPIVNLRVLKDKNFAIGCFAIFCMAFILYSSAVLIPQLAQRTFGWDATWAGLVLSPGAALIVVCIPLLGRVLPLIQLRYFIAFGFFVMGCALTYSHTLTPELDFRTLAFMRMAQTFALAFLFVPISTISYVTIPKKLNGDAAALYTMFRNVAGAIGISLSTAMITSRTQVRMAHLSQYMTSLWQPFNDAVGQIRNALRMAGQDPGLASGIMYSTYVKQATVLAYEDVFAACAIMAFCVVPFTFLFSPVKSGGARGGH